MIARVAENLYWIGRNLERCEYSCRYMREQFFSTLDAPMSKNKDFILWSILFLSGTNYQAQGTLNENEVWHKVIFDPNNASGLLNLVRNIRENARSIRNNLSQPLWESINKWYLNTQSIDYTTFSSDNLYEFTEEMLSEIMVIKSKLHYTLLHDEVWKFIGLGIHLERVLQIIRIIKGKISDGVILSDNGKNKQLLDYHRMSMLRSLGAFEIYKKHYRNSEGEAAIFNLILSNKDFTRSLIYAVDKLKRYLVGISAQPEGYEALIAKYEQLYKDYLVFDDVFSEDNIIQQIDKVYNEIAQFHFEIEQLYFRI